MEVSINNEKKQEAKEMSQFCETLMKVTGAIGFLRQPNECAIVLCADGTTMSSRQAGLYPDVLNMVYMKMLNDDKFAELIIEASILYSQHIQGKTALDNQSEKQDGKSEESMES